MQFYGEITQQLLKNAAFPGSNNGTGLFQVDFYCLFGLSSTVYTPGHPSHEWHNPQAALRMALGFARVSLTVFENDLQTLVGLKIREVYEHITQKDLAPAVSR